jgi:hypothetical protein
MKSANVAPVNSLLLIADVSGGDEPEFIPGVPVLATASCISIGCLMWQDGETKVTLALSDEIELPGPPAFDGALETPNKIVTISTVEGDRILQASVSTVRTRVRIWMNRSLEPDDIIIGLS